MRRTHEKENIILAFVNRPDEGNKVTGTANHLMISPSQFRRIVDGMDGLDVQHLDFCDHYGVHGATVEAQVLLDVIGDLNLGVRGIEKIHHLVERAAQASASLHLQDGRRGNNVQATITIETPEPVWVPEAPPDGLRLLCIVLGGHLDADDITCRYLPQVDRLGYITDPASVFGGCGNRFDDWRNGIPSGWAPEEEDEQVEALFSSEAGTQWLAEATAAAREAGAVILRDGYTSVWAWDRIVPRLVEHFDHYVPVYLLPPTSLVDGAPTLAWRDAWDDAMRDLKERHRGGRTPA